MRETGSVLDELRQIFKFYERLTAPICKKYAMTRTETDVLCFLANNYGMDTAKQIVELRHIPKANVSQAVEQLIRKGMLTRIPDSHDRRTIHLQLTEVAQPALMDIQGIREDMDRKLFCGFTPEQQAEFKSMHDRISHNVRAAMERMEQDELG